MTLKRLSSALRARLVLTVLIIASISVLGSGGTVTAQQNNTTTTAQRQRQRHTPEPAPTPTPKITTLTPTSTPFTETVDAGADGSEALVLLMDDVINDFGIPIAIIAGLAILLTAYRVST